MFFYLPNQSSFGFPNYSVEVARRGLFPQRVLGKPLAVKGGSISQGRKTRAAGPAAAATALGTRLVLTRA